MESSVIRASHLRSLFNNSGSTLRVPEEPSPDEHPAFRKKSPFLNFRIFGGRNESTASEVNTASTNTNPQSPGSLGASNNGTSGSSQTRNLRSHPSRHWHSPINYEAPPCRVRRPREQRHADAAALVRRSRRRRGCLGPYRAYLSTALKNREVRKNLIRCGVAGFLLLAIMATYLGLAISANSPVGQEFHIVLILLVMIFTIIFCHSLVRAIMLVMRVGKDGQVLNQKPSMSTLGYAQTDRPIPVVLACDEELAAENDGAIHKVIPPPPAYGRWRSSVRINPDGIQWHRVECPVAKMPMPRRSAKRPPSYTSNNGVDYVLNAQPRSIAPK